MINKGLFTSNKDDWETPQDLFNNLDKRFHFDLDVCANQKNHKCKKYYTKEQDGLKQEWNGFIWCNPPYGKEISKWVKAVSEYEGGGVMLLPARTDTRWFHNYIYHKSEIIFLKGRLHFSNSKYAAPFPSMIVIFRRKND